MKEDDVSQQIPVDSPYLNDPLDQPPSICQTIISVPSVSSANNNNNNTTISESVSSSRSTSRTSSETKTDAVKVR